MEKLISVLLTNIFSVKCCLLNYVYILYILIVFSRSDSLFILKYFVLKLRNSKSESLQKKKTKKKTKEKEKNEMELNFQTYHIVRYF